MWKYLTLFFLLAFSSEAQDAPNAIFKNLTVQQASTLAGSLTLSQQAINNIAGYLNVLLGVSVTPEQYNAVCNGITDDTNAIAAWAANLEFYEGFIPWGSKCVTKSPIAFPNYNIVIKGASPTVSKLIYNGTTTTGDILYFGQGTAGAGTANIHLENVDFESQTVMTAGNLIHIQNMGGGVSTLENIWVGPYFHSNWNAVYLDNAATLNVNHFWFESPSADALDISTNGQSAGIGAGVNLTNGFLINSKLGLHLGGGVGGFYTSLVSLGGNGQDLLYDEALSNVTNLQVEFGNFTSFDLVNGDKAAVELSTSGSAVQQYVNFAGGWFSGGGQSNGCDLQIDTGFVGYITGIGNTFVNDTTGICNKSATAYENFQSNYFYSLTNGITDSGSDPNLRAVNNNFVAVTNPYPLSMVTAGRTILGAYSNYSQIPASPVTNATTTYVMAGLGSTVVMQPQGSGLVRATWQANLENSTATDGCTIAPVYGTGTAPSEGAAATGTYWVAGQQGQMTSATSDAQASVTVEGLLALTPGATYWFDLAFKAQGGGTCYLFSTTANLLEQ